MTVHTYPANDPRGEHQTDGTECWCEPECEWIDPDTGLPYEDGPLVKHNAPLGYPGREEDE